MTSLELAKDPTVSIMPMEHVVIYRTLGGATKGSWRSMAITASKFRPA